MTAKKDITGRRFGLLSVLRENGKLSGKIAWLCRCNCGNERTIRVSSLVRGLTQSCGCVGRSRAGTLNLSHGEAGLRTPEYNTWKSIKSRCLNPNSTGYEYYGGRGITICDRWRDSFESFLADVGRRPSAKHSIDRYPDNNGNYEPGNVRWATASEQCFNRRKWTRRKAA